MNHKQTPEFAYYIFTHPDLALIFVDHTVKKSLTQSDIEHRPLAIAVARSTAERPNALFDPFNVFENKDLYISMHSYLRSAFLYTANKPSNVFPCVRRQGFWERLLLRLSERLAHLLIDFRRLDCGIANAAV